MYGVARAMQGRVMVAAKWPRGLVGARAGKDIGR